MRSRAARNKARGADVSRAPRLRIMQGSMLAAALLALWATDAALPPRDDDLSTRRIAPLVRLRRSSAFMHQRIIAKHSNMLTRKC